MTIAFAPCATAELTSEIIFWRSPPPASTICLTFLHFAASERTAANDSCDHALMPNPSRTASVIGFVPQNAISVEIPDLAISWVAVGQVTDVFVVAAVADTAAHASATSASAASRNPRRLRSSERTRTTDLLNVSVLLVITTSSTPRMCGVHVCVFDSTRSDERRSGSRVLGRRGVIGAAEVRQHRREKPPHVSPGHVSDCHPERDDRALDDHLDGRGRSHAEHHRTELREEERSYRGRDDASLPARERRAAEHHRRDRGQEVVVAGADPGSAQKARDENPRAAVRKAREHVGRELDPPDADAGGARRRRAGSSEDEAPPEHGRADDDRHRDDGEHGDEHRGREPER